MAEIYLLDTNVVAAFFNGDADVLKRVKESSVFLSATIIGELFYGAYNSGRQIANLARLEDFESSNVCFDCDSNTAKIYGHLRQTLKVKGRPIPENDMWIAATAIQHDLVLATRDSHFEAIDGLKLEIW